MLRHSHTVQIVRLVGALVSAFLTALSIVLDWQGLAPGAFNWHIGALVGFVVFGVLMVWMVAERQARISELVSRRPKPVVTIRKDYQSVVLEVRNDGESATFECEVRFVSFRLSVSSGNQPSPDMRLRPLWDSGDTVTKIPRGGTKSLYLARSERDPIGGVSVGVYFPFTEDRTRAIPAFSISWIPGAQPALPVSQVTVEISIITDPSPITGVVRKLYSIDALGECTEAQA